MRFLEEACRFWLKIPYHAAARKGIPVKTQKEPDAAQGDVGPVPETEVYFDRRIRASCLIGAKPQGVPQLYVTVADRSAFGESSGA